MRTDVEQRRRAPLQAADQSKQRLRLRRFLFASAFSVLYVVVLAVLWTQDMIDRATLVEAGVLVVALILAFLVLIRTGLNLRFPDPSLTAWQFVAAVAVMVYVVYRAPDTRLAFSAFFFVALMFGMLRHSSRKLALLAAVSLVSFALVIWLRYRRDLDVAVLRLDIVQWIVIAVTFPWFLFIGAHVKRLKRGLDEVSIRLDDIEEQARRDELTGIYNRRALLVAMEESKQRADAAKEPLSICVIDLDHFKRFNDEFNHLVGDQVLRLFAQEAQRGLRATDIFGRYGGEEFVQILRQTPLAGAVADAERLRARIDQLKLPFDSAGGPLTVSMGVAQYQPGEMILQTFARADAALYRAKQKGRNRVEY